MSSAQLDPSTLAVEPADAPTIAAAVAPLAAFGMRLAPETRPEGRRERRLGVGGVARGIRQDSTRRERRSPHSGRPASHPLRHPGRRRSSTRASAWPTSCSATGSRLLPLFVPLDAVGAERHRRARFLCTGGSHTCIRPATALKGQRVRARSRHRARRRRRVLGSATTRRRVGACCPALRRAAHGARTVTRQRQAPTAGSPDHWPTMCRGPTRQPPIWSSSYRRTSADIEGPFAGLADRCLGRGGSRSNRIARRSTPSAREPAPQCARDDGPRGACEPSLGACSTGRAFGRLARRQAVDDRFGRADRDRGDRSCQSHAWLRSNTCRAMPRSCPRSTSRAPGCRRARDSRSRSLRKSSGIRSYVPFLSEVK